MPQDYKNFPLSIVIVGASGDLARHKIVPALFALYCHRLLPRRCQVIGFARSEHTDDSFRALLSETLTCRHRPARHCRRLVREFLARCFYCRGDYAARDAFLDVYLRMRRVEQGAGGGNRLFYLAVPPLVFQDVARAIGDAGLVHCQGPRWSRVIVEKPFGMDRASSDRLVRELRTIFTEDQTYRIDHYLGKEVIQNLMVLRFANAVFEPLWNRRYVAGVEIVWHEDAGLEGRGGYFDHYGIIRDVMQNHLLQMLALTAMERPGRLDNPDAVRNAKVRLLRAVAPVRAGDLLLGQYRGARAAGRWRAGYRQEDHVAPDSRTPTFAAARLRVNNPRWRGVPFYLEAGKALRDRLTEIRIHFRRALPSVFRDQSSPMPANALVIRVQPDEGIYLRIINKAPGLAMALAPTMLDLRYAAAFPRHPIPSAYECLLWEALAGDRSLFISEAELAAAWDVFTPALHALAARRRAPLPYDFGSDGPERPSARRSRPAQPGPELRQGGGW